MHLCVPANFSPILRTSKVNDNICHAFNAGKPKFPRKTMEIGHESSVSVLARQLSKSHFGTRISKVFLNAMSKLYKNDVFVWVLKQSAEPNFQHDRINQPSHASPRSNATHLLGVRMLMRVYLSEPTSSIQHCTSSYVACLFLKAPASATPAISCRQKLQVQVY